MAAKGTVSALPLASHLFSSLKHQVISMVKYSFFPFCFHVIAMPLKDQLKKKKKKRLRERLFGLRKRCPQHRPNRLPGFIGLSLVFNKDCCSDNKEKHLLPCKCLACFNSLYVSFLREQFGLIKTQASILYFDTSPAR